jgi:hypothetical protein
MLEIFVKLFKPLFRGHLGLSNGISPSKIGCFLVEIWPIVNETEVLKRFEEF